MDIPETKKAVRIWPWVFLCAAIVIAVAGYFFRSRLAPITQRNENPVAVPAATIKSTILKQAQFSFPAVKSSEAIQVQDWPPDLTFLLPQNSTRHILQMAKATYSDGHTGYMASLDQTSALEKDYSRYWALMVNTAGWSLANGVRANAFSLLEGENEKHQAQITHQLIEEKNNLLEVKIYQK